MSCGEPQTKITMVLFFVKTHVHPPTHTDTHTDTHSESGNRRAMLDVDRHVKVGDGGIERLKG